MRILLLTILSMLIMASCGKRIDTIEEKDESGRITEKFFVISNTDQKHGTYTGYYDNGVVREEAHYINNVLDGERKIYYPTGELNIVEQHVNGQFIGAFKSYYKSGQLELLGEYVANVMSGKWKRYYENGQLMEIVSFQDNNENGSFIEYYENGNLKAEGSYLDGDNEHGLLKLYNEQGALERKMDCQHGVCKTIWLASEEPSI